MVKKLQKMAEKQAAAGSASGLFDSALAGTVKESAQQIWLAGLGAFSKAQAEGGKVFEALVKEGTHLQKKTQSAAEEKLGEVTNRMTSMAGDVTAKAGQQWDKLESIFEDRTAKAMSKLPTDRYETVSAFIDDIERYQKNLPVRAQPERLSYRVRKFVRRNRGGVAAAAVLTVAAQTVQVSAYPQAYAKHETQAGNIINALYGTGPYADQATDLR